MYSMDFNKFLIDFNGFQWMFLYKSFFLELLRAFSVGSFAFIAQETCTDRVVNQYVHEWKRAQKAVKDFLRMNGFQDVHSAKGKWTRSYPLHEAAKQQDAYVTAKLLMFGADPDAKLLDGLKVAIEEMAYVNIRKQLTLSHIIFFNDIERYSFIYCICIRLYNKYTDNRGWRDLLRNTWGRRAAEYARDASVTAVFEVHRLRHRAPAVKGKCLGPGALGAPPPRPRHRVQRAPPPRGFEEFFALVERDPLVPDS